MTKPFFVLIAYCVGTVCYILFHFNFIHTNRLVEANNTVAYVVSYSLFFLIPIAGLVHLSFLKLNKRAFKGIVKWSCIIGLAGPLIHHFFITISDDGEAAMGYAVFPATYLATCLIGYVLLFTYQCVDRKIPDKSKTKKDQVF